MTDDPVNSLDLAIIDDLSTPMILSKTTLLGCRVLVCDR